MAWKTYSAQEKVYTQEELLRKETTWYSSYNEADRWIKDMKACHYSLAGEYEIEKNLILYRFELDETKRAELANGAPHYQNVIINTSLPEVKVSEIGQLLHKK